MLVHVVADYGPAGDLAFAEVAQRLAAELPGAMVVATPVAPFDTLAAGFVIAQLALNEGPADRVIFHNVAPRRDERDAREANEGEGFTVGRTAAGTLVVGPNSGHSLAFVAGEMPLHVLDVPAAGSQFRSRDFLPGAIGRLARGDRDVILEPLGRARSRRSRRTSSPTPTGTATSRPRWSSRRPQAASGCSSASGPPRRPRWSPTARSRGRRRALTRSRLLGVAAGRRRRAAVPRALPARWQRRRAPRTSAVGLCHPDQPM
jgi:hypothetical protein